MEVLAHVPEAEYGGLGQDLASIVGATVLYALIRYGGRARYRPLPGPPGHAIIGNVFDIPREAPWMTYKQWSHDYGEL